MIVDMKQHQITTTSTAHTQMLRSIIDVNCPKFLQYDIVLFQGIMSDIFPGVELPQLDYSVFKAQVEAVSATHNLQCTPSFFQKVLQTFEMMVLRHGFVCAF